MGTDIILYDRLWLGRYIDGLKHQRNLLRLIKYNLSRARAKDLPELQVYYEGILIHVRELEQSLEITEIVLEKYLDDVQNEAIKFQRQCQEIELPVFIEMGNSDEWE